MDNEIIKNKENEEIIGFDDIDEEDTQSKKYLSFILQDKRYGINISYINEIIEVQKIMIFPNTQKYIKGVINLRGKIIPVIDLRLRFDMEEKEYDFKTCIIIVNVDSIVVGLLVDTVSETMIIPDENISQSSDLIESKYKHKFISGIAKLENNNVLMIVNVKEIL